MVVKTCVRCGDKYETTSIDQVLCYDCQNIIKKCSTKNSTFVILKSEPTRAFRAVKYIPETKVVIIEESDLNTKSVDLNFIIDVKIGCMRCDPTRRHTHHDAFLPANILSPEEVLRGIHVGFKFCPYCGREL